MFSVAVAALGSPCWSRRCLGRGSWWPRLPGRPADLEAALLSNGHELIVVLGLLDDVRRGLAVDEEPLNDLLLDVFLEAFVRRRSARLEHQVPLEGLGQHLQELEAKRAVTWDIAASLTHLAERRIPVFHAWKYVLHPFEARRVVDLALRRHDAVVAAEVDRVDEAAPCVEAVHVGRVGERREGLV